MLSNFKKSRKKYLEIKLTSKGSLNSICLLKRALIEGSLPKELADEQLNNDSLFISQISGICPNFI